MLFQTVTILAAFVTTSSVNGFTTPVVVTTSNNNHDGGRLYVSTEPKQTQDETLFVDATTSSTTTTQSSVQDYYGKTLSTSDDLKTNACCAGVQPPNYIKDAINNIHPTVKAKYYGCGLCLPQYDLTGAKILDLGCGAGRDVYIASQLVGPTGKVVGVDMTPEQLQVARETQVSYYGKNCVQQ